jgi:hypothetical protein
VVPHSKARAVEVVPVPEVSPTSGVWLSRRDLTLVAIGLGAVVAMAGFIAAIVLLLRK